MKRLALLPLLALLAACGDTVTEPEANPLQATTAAAPSAAGVPADGNGNKFVGYWEATWPVSCSGATITGSYAGWGQFRAFGPPNNRNVELAIFHFVFTYMNSNGETWVWRDVGPDRSYVDDNGDLIFAVSGRSTASGTPDRDEIVVGHMVLNATTGVVEFIAGRQLGGVDDLACSELT
jgi:hypothetical protein